MRIGAQWRGASTPTKAMARPTGPRLWGKHAVAAALDNPSRKVLRAWATRDAAAVMQFPEYVPLTFADVADLGRLVPHDAPHQGVVIEVEPLEDAWLDDLLGPDAGARGAAGPRPGHRPAQCRRDPALGGGVRGGRDRHPGPPLAARKRGRRQGRFGSARAGAVGAGRQPRPGARGDRRGGFLADRPCRRRR